MDLDIVLFMYYLAIRSHSALAFYFFFNAFNSEKNICQFIPPAIKASREVANLTERKSTYPVYGVKEFVCQSVTKFDLNYQGLAKQNGLKFSVCPKSGR